MPQVRFCWLLTIVVIGLSLSEPSLAQRTGRRAVTLDTLEEHSSFFNGEEVIVHADAVGEGVLTYLTDGLQRVLVLNVPPPPQGTRDRLEIIGTFYDVGRLEPNDPRTIDQPFEQLAESLLQKAWPGVGELKLLVAESALPPSQPNLVSLRTVALDPEAHLESGITVTGRFRGRNLYGDLPDSPGLSQHDFVLTSAEASIWVVGMEPKGDGFELDVQARIDTGRWLEVTGDVRVHEGMVILYAGSIRSAEPVEQQPVTTRVSLRQGPPPEIIFSTPLEGDADITTDTTVRIQFSRDMDPASFQERVRASYPQDSSGNLTEDSSPLLFEMDYRGLNRVLEIRFINPLLLFRTVNVNLSAGVTASDGAVLAPWSLSFVVGREGR
jgi:hypothetical protein